MQYSIQIHKSDGKIKAKQITQQNEWAKWNEWNWMGEVKLWRTNNEEADTRAKSKDSSAFSCQPPTGLQNICWLIKRQRKSHARPSHDRYMWMHVYCIVTLLHIACHRSLLASLKICSSFLNFMVNAMEWGGATATHRRRRIHACQKRTLPTRRSIYIWKQDTPRAQLHQ